MPVLRWSVRIDPAVGEPFLGNWKASLQEPPICGQFGKPWSATEAIEAGRATPPA